MHYKRHEARSNPKQRNTPIFDGGDSNESIVKRRLIINPRRFQA